MPWLDRLPQLELDTAIRDGAVAREAKLEKRQEPFVAERIARTREIVDDIAEILRDKMRQHEPVVQIGSPRDEPPLERRLPESCDERTQQQHLQQAHPRMRRHLERAELEQAQPAGGRFGRVELVDRELGAVRVAGQVDEE